MKIELIKIYKGFLLLNLLLYQIYASAQLDTNQNDINSVQLSLSVVSYELANSYKIKADELFLKEEFHYAEKSYLKAQEILQDPDRFIPDTFDKSRYVTGFNINMGQSLSEEVSKIYRELLAKDIEYRLSLLRVGEDFYGIDFSQKILLPGVRLKRWKQSVAQLLDTWNEIDELLDEKVDLEETDSATRAKRIKDSYNELINIKNKEKVDIIQTVATKKMKNFEDRNQENMKQQKKFSEDLKSLSDDLTAAEADILDNFTKTLEAAFSMPQLSQVQGLVEGKDISIQSVLKAGGQYFEPFEQLGEKAAWIEDICSQISTSEKIIKFLNNPDDEEFMEILGEIAPDNKDIKTLREWYEKGDQIVKTVEGVNRCSKNFTYDCLSSNVNKVIDQIDPKLRQDWKLLSQSLENIEIAEVAEDITNLINTGELEYGLRLGDKISTLDHDFKQGWDKGRELGAKFESAIEQESFKGFFDFGKDLVDQGVIPLPEFKNIKKEVIKSKPLGILLEYSRHKVGNEFLLVFDEINRISKNKASNTLIDRANFNAAVNYNSPSDEFQILLYQELINAFPDAFIGQLDKHTKIQVANNLAIPSLTKEHFNPGKPLRITKVGDSFLIGDAILPLLNTMISYGRNQVAINNNLNLKGFTDLAIMTAYEFQNHTKKYYKTADLVDMMKGDAGAYDRILSLISLNSKTKYDNYATYIQLGRYAYFGDGKDFKGVPAAQAHRKNVVKNLINESKTTTDPKLKEALSRQALSMGLNTAIPGLGSTVNTAIDFFASMSNASNLIGQMNEKSRQIKEKQKEILVLDEKILDANEKLSIAHIEEERMDLITRLFEFENKETNVFLNKVRYKQQEVRNELKYLLPIFFYQCEIVRQNYYLLNKSVKFWHGYSMNELISENSNNIRLAIDPDIRLFEWLRLDKRGQRINLEQIIKQWNRIDKLFPTDSDNSELIIKGPDRIIAFEKGTSFSVFQYANISKDEYYQWREDAHSHLDIKFSLAPDSGYFGKYYVNGRLARVTVSDPQGKSIPNGTEIDLELPYQVLRESEIEHEYLKIQPANLSGSNRGIETDWRDMKEYKESFAEDRDPETLEGVGIHANFILRLPYLNANQFQQIDDIIIDMSWTYDGSSKFKRTNVIEPEYDSVDIFLSDSPYDYSRFTRKELLNEARTISEMQSYLEKRKEKNEIFDYKINRPVFKLNYN